MTAGYKQPLEAIRIVAIVETWCRHNPPRLGTQSLDAKERPRFEQLLACLLTDWLAGWLEHFHSPSVAHASFRSACSQLGIIVSPFSTSSEASPSHCLLGQCWTLHAPGFSSSSSIDNREIPVDLVIDNTVSVFSYGPMAFRII